MVSTSSSDGFNYFYWIISNTTFWSFGFAIGLIAGFSLPVIGDVIAVIIFTTSTLYFQFRLLRYNYEWSTQYIRKSIIGFLIGLTLSFAFTLIADDFIGLSFAHILAFPIVLFFTAFHQYQILNEYYSNAQIWLLMNVLSAITSFIIIGLISLFVDLRFDLLDVRNKDYAAVFPWWIVGVIMGHSYGVFTGLLLSNKRFKRLLKTVN
ncbi:MAG: hypothetical protein ACW99A_07075 [Candidatus Kariarchaeaceae archaeon]